MLKYADGCKSCQPGLRWTAATKAKDFTLDDLMQLTTDKTYILAVHGIIRYHSRYIPGGVDEATWCYEFDPLTSQMVACRVPPLRTDHGPRTDYGPRPKN